MIICGLAWISAIYGAAGVELPAGWLPVLGRWEMVEGKISVLGTQSGGDADRNEQGTGAVVLVGGANWRDCRVGLRNTGSSDVVHLLLRAKNDRNCIQFGRDGSSYTLSVLKDGVATVKAREDVGRLASPESLAAEIRGNVFMGYRDGALVFEHTFRAGEIPAEGRAGIQTNHQGRKAFDQWESECTKDSGAKPVARQVEIESIKLTGNTCGPQRLLVQVRDSAGVDDVQAVTCDATARQGAPLPVDALRLEKRLSGTVSVWSAPFFFLCEGPHELKVRVVDGDDKAHEKPARVELAARPGTFVAVGKKKIFENIDPHPVWRALVTEDQAHGSKTIGNYLWNVEWGPSQIRCRALTVEPDRADKPYVGRRIVPDDGTLAIRPRLRTADGRELTGPVTRRLGEPATMFGLQATYEMVTPDGVLTWWVRVLNGDPILRFGGIFVPEKSVELTCEWAVENGYKATGQVAAGDNFAAWRPSDRAEGPVFTWAFNRKRQKGDAPGFVFAPARISRGQKYELPMLGLAVVDSRADYANLKDAPAWASRLAQLALAVPRMDAAWQDLGASAGQCRVALDRGYDFLQNDWHIADAGQFLALPWCAGSKAATGEFHSAFGLRPYVVTKEKRVVLDLPLPELAPEKLTPPYAPLAGDWQRKAQECVDYLATQQNADGTFRGHDRMDQYWLARMTLGLMISYRGFEDRSATQAKIAVMVRKALARMMGEERVVLGEETTLRKQFGSGVEELTWTKGENYNPFQYSPRWNMATEMGGLVDQNLGHAHLLFTLLLYATYLDPGYVTRPEIRDKIEEMIKFQWLSQDWNGDIWRVYVGGGDAAGGGDGFEEDLAMVLPRLAELAGLELPWRNLAARISAMKFGALRNFDYLPVNNEWGYEFLAPIHHPGDWMPEGGWERKYAGDVWLTGPAVCGGIYGPWYAESVYRPIPDVFGRMWYDLLEDERDVIRADDRHWLTIGGYCSEAQISDPFLGAVKLMRAYAVARERGFLTPQTRGDALWNFAFYPAAMTLVQHALVTRHPFMKDAEPVADAATSSDPEQAPAYAWKLPDGAIISVAAYRTKAPVAATVRVDADKLGLGGQDWELTDLKTGTKRRAPAGQPIEIEVAPRSATTLRIAGAAN